MCELAGITAPINYILQHLRDTVTAKEVTLPGVNWEPVDRLGRHNKPYIDFPGIIKQERLPSLFPSLTVVRKTNCMCRFQCGFLSHDIIPLPVT